MAKHIDPRDDAAIAAYVSADRVCKNMGYNPAANGRRYRLKRMGGKAGQMNVRERRLFLVA